MAPSQKAQIESATLKVFVVALIGEMGRLLPAAEGNALVARLLEDCHGLIGTIGVDVSESSLSEDEFRSAMASEIDGLLGTINFRD